MPATFVSWELRRFTDRCRLQTHTIHMSSKSPAIVHGVKAFHSCFFVSIRGSTDSAGVGPRTGLEPINAERIVITFSLGSAICRLKRGGSNAIHPERAQAR